MYHIGTTHSLRAWHFLTGADFGPEGSLHSHDYRIEWTLEGPELDPLGFLANLALVADHLEAVVNRLEGRTLNELPGWEGLNPSVERLARYLADQLGDVQAHWDPQNRVKGFEVKVWESTTAWASWTVKP
jgi:6-pyruvoyltetrahydropterin/6-carboxytetrahydropterin synthase